MEAFFSMTKKKAVIFGYHGMKNFGDDFFLNYILKKLSEKEIKRCYVTARGNVEKSDYESDFEVVEILPKVNRFKGYDKWLLLFLYALKSDYLIFCAGSIFTILPEKVFYLIISLAKLLNRRLKILAIGVSIGPFASHIQEQRVVSALSLFDRVVVRDKKSCSYGALSNRKFVRDIAFTHPPRLTEKNTPLGIALNPYASIFPEGKLESELLRNTKIVESITESICPDAGTIKVFVTCSDEKYGDTLLSQDLIKKLKAQGYSTKLVSYEGNIKRFEDELASVEKLIASRLHAGFFAVLAGCQVFQLMYAEKIKEFYFGLNLQSISFAAAYSFERSILTEFLKSEYKHIESDYNTLLNLSIKVSDEYSHELSIIK